MLGGLGVRQQKRSRKHALKYRKAKTLWFDCVRTLALVLKEGSSRQDCICLLQIQGCNNVHTTVRRRAPLWLRSTKPACSGNTWSEVGGKTMWIVSSNIDLYE